jgi:hypothetical protein
MVQAFYDIENNKTATVRGFANSTHTSAPGEAVR